MAVKLVKVAMTKLCAVPTLPRLSLLTLSILIALLAGITYNSTHPGDYKIIYAAGETFWHGSIADAYDMEKFSSAILGDGYQPVPLWTYPPQYNFVTLTFAIMPRWLSYLVFMGLTLGTFVGVIRSLAPSHFQYVLLAGVPYMAVNVMAGQNGFLTGTLAGLFVLLCLRRSKSAGLPLGALIIKPHLGVGLGAYLVLTRRWSEISIGAAVAIASALASTLTFGPQIWAAVANSMQEAGDLLAQVYFPLHRMTSVYASLRSLGLEAQTAFWAQILVALSGVGMTGWAVYRGWSPKHVLAITLLSSLMVSPYQYDYDMAQLIVVLERSTVFPDRAWLALLALVWFTCTYGMSAVYVEHWGKQAGILADDDPTVSLAGLTLVGIIILVFSMLLRFNRIGSGSLHPVRL
jgi:hypothetical protein